MGGTRQGYPSTLWTAILGARDREAKDFRDNLDRLIRAYWKPVYWTLRTRWRRSNDQAKDLTQAFFLSFMEKDRLADVSPEKGRFRAFLRVVLDNFMRNELEAARALKRGGGARIVPIDAGDDELPLEADTLRPEEVFDRAWATHLFREAVAELEGGIDKAAFQAFRRHELDRDPPPYPKLAQELDVSVHEVESLLKKSRTALARILRARVRDTLSDDASVEDELRTLQSALG